MYCRSEHRLDKEQRDLTGTKKGLSVVDKNSNLNIIKLCDSHVKLHANSYPLDTAQAHYGIPSNELMKGLRRKIYEEITQFAPGF